MTEVRIKKQYISVYCLCGASMQGWISPPGHADPLKAKWLAVHKGAGHGPATVAQAQAAPRREQEST